MNMVHLLREQFHSDGIPKDICTVSQPTTAKEECVMCYVLNPKGSDMATVFGRVVRVNV